jgi:hypothetical protein
VEGYPDNFQNNRNGNIQKNTSSTKDEVNGQVCLFLSSR